VVTLTLPESTLAELEMLDEDRARAVVRAANVASGNTKQRLNRGNVDILAVGEGTGLIVVPYSRVLSALPGVSLMEITPGGYLLVLQPGTALASIELAVSDMLDQRDLGSANHSILIDLLNKLKQSRRRKGTRTGEVILLELDETRLE
jgi:hypothetical protein